MLHLIFSLKWFICHLIGLRGNEKTEINTLFNQLEVNIGKEQRGHICTKMFQELVNFSVQPIEIYN